MIYAIFDVILHNRSYSTRGLKKKARDIQWVATNSIIFLKPISSLNVYRLD